jgi:hypothetical protein
MNARQPKCGGCKQPWQNGHRCPPTDAAYAKRASNFTRFAELVYRGAPPVEAGRMATTEVEA